MACNAISFTFLLPSSVYTGTPTCSPTTFNCSIAAGRYTSHATRSGFLCCLVLSILASLPLNVVLPEPCKPDISTIEGLPSRLSPTASPPISCASSSCTILTMSCPGLTAVRTFMPRAFFLTVSVNDLATLKLTSASSSARRTSFIVSATLISVIRPSPFSILNERSSLSLKFSNIV